MAYSDLGGGAFPAALQPTQGKNLYGGNYLNFTDGSVNQWAQQFLPDVYDKEVEIYGNRTISSFLRMVSAEMPSTSDQIIWLEQGRLHTRYTGLAHTATLPTSEANASAPRSASALAGGFTLHFALTGAQAGPAGSSTSTTEGDDQINFRIGQTVMIQKQSSGSGDISRGTGTVLKGIITDVNAVAFSVSVYKAVATIRGDYCCRSFYSFSIWF